MSKGGKDKAFRYLETKKNQVEREKKRTASIKQELCRTELALKKANHTIEKLRCEVIKLNDTVNLQRSLIEDLTDTAADCNLYGESYGTGGEICNESMPDLQVGYSFG